MKFFTYILFLLSLPALAQIETISWDDASISNKLTLTVAKRDFDKIYKKADSIIKPDYTKVCGADADSNFEYVYYKGLMFEMDNGIMNFRYIMLSNSPKAPLYFVHKGITFNGITKLADVQKLFPVAGATVEDSDDKVYKVIKLNSAEAGDDSEWFFYFKNGQLAMIECQFMC